MKSVLKRSLALALSLILVLGTCFVSGVVSAPVASAAEGKSKVQSYADLVAEYGQNGDGFVYTGLEFYEADGKLTDYYVKSGDELTARVYIKSNLWVGESYILTLYDNKFFDIKLAGGPDSTTVSTGYTSNYQQAPRNSQHPIVIANNSGHTLTTINITNVGWIKNLCGYSTTYLAETDLAQSNTATDITVSTESYDMRNDIWLFEYYVKVKTGLADGTKGIVTSPDTLWHSSINPATGKHDARKKAYIAVVDPANYDAGNTKLTNTTTMALCMDGGIIDHFIKDHEHEFTIGDAPVMSNVSFKLDDGTDFIPAAQYKSGDAINAPTPNPEKADHDFLGWAVEGTTDIVTFPQTAGKTDVTYVAQFKVVPKYTATFVVEGETVSEEQYKEGETIVVPADPSKDGFTFIGWDPVPGTMPAEDMTFTAQFREKSAVYFMDGETQLNVVKGEAGETVAKPEDPSKEGYTFNGWVDSADAEVTFPVTITDGTTYIYASWTAIKYEVSFDNDGETSGGEFDFGTTVALPTPAAKKGHTFKGWFDENGNEFTAESTVPVGGVKLTAKFEKNTYIATFDATIGAFEDGEKTKTVPTVYGEQIVAPANPVKEGYKFIDWDDEVGAMSDADKTFTAVWQIQSYNVTWNFDNGEDAQVDTVVYDEPVNAPADPVKEGHTFAGWDAEIPENMTANNLEFTAKWTVNEYTVTWNNEGETTTQTVKYGEKVTGEELTAIGREFHGWKVDGATEHVEFPFTMPASDVTFVADWEYLWYSVTWDVEGEKTEAEYHYGDEIAAPADPVKEGYTFKGWTPEVPATMPAEDLAFVAIFEVNSYDVTWDFDNGEDAQVDSVEFGAEIATPTDPVKVGHTFTGWTPEIPESMPANALSFVATWVKNFYNAIFDANGGQFADGSDKAIISTEFEAAVATPSEPTKDGATFVAWNPTVADVMPAEDVTYEAVWAEGEGIPYIVETYTMDENGNYGSGEVAGYVVETEQTVTLAPAAPEGFYLDEELSVLSAEVTEAEVAVIKIYFARNQYSIVFDANGGLIDGAATQTDAIYYHGAAVATPADPAKVGHTFNGWDPIVEAVAKADVKYIAQWLVNKYTITFDSNGGSEVAPITQDYGTEIVAPADPTREGYTFEGWNAEIPATMPAEDITLVAIWAELDTPEDPENPDDPATPGDPDKPEDPDLPPATPGDPEKPECEHVAGEWEIVTEATYEADGEAVKKCTECGEIIDTAVISKLLLPDLKLTDENGNAIPGDLEIRYGESATIKVSDSTLPEGTFVKWIVEGDGVEFTVSEDGLSITLTSVESGDIKVKALVVNADGEAILDEFGCENSVEIEVKSDACFFWKIVHFIKSLFNFSFFKNIFGFIC